MFATLLIFGILTVWVDEKWPWSAFQLGVFLLAASLIGARGDTRICGVEARPGVADPARIAFFLLAAAAAWPMIQFWAHMTVSPDETWNAALNWATYLAVFVAASAILSEAPARRCFVAALAICGFVLAAVASLQAYSSGGKIFWLFPSAFASDVWGPFVNRNQYAAWVELVIPFALYQAIASSRYRVLFGCAAAVMFASVVACASRAGFLLTTGEVVLVTVVASRAARQKAIPFVAQFAVLAVLAVAVIGWRALPDRLAARQAETLRIDAVRASGHMILDRPWTGSGLGSWPVVYPRYATIDTGVVLNQAHNDWLQWAAEGGLPFAAVLLVFAVLLCKPAFQSIYGLGTIAFLAHALVDFPFQQRPALAAWFFAVAGAAMSYRSCRRTRSMSPG